MIIDGVEVKPYLTKKQTTERYEKILIREVRRALQIFPRVVKMWVDVSKTTESIYYNVLFRGIPYPIVVSLRTHPPKKELDNYVYVYLQNFRTLNALNSYIKVQVVQKHNEHIIQFGGKKLPYDMGSKSYKKVKEPNTKKKNKNKKLSKQDLRKMDNQRFRDLMREINSRK